MSASTTRMPSRARVSSSASSGGHFRASPTRSASWPTELGLQGMPTTYFLDADHRVAGVIVGGADLAGFEKGVELIARGRVAVTDIELGPLGPRGRVRRGVRLLHLAVRAAARPRLPVVRLGRRLRRARRALAPCGHHDGRVRPGLHGDVRAPGGRCGLVRHRAARAPAHARDHRGRLHDPRGARDRRAPAPEGPGRRATPPHGERRRATPLRGSPASSSPWAGPPASARRSAPS